MWIVFGTFWIRFRVREGARKIRGEGEEDGSEAIEWG